MTGPFADVGATLGVEEEYHLVDAVSGALVAAPEVVVAANTRFGGVVQGEISTAQLEVATPVSTSLAEVRAHLVRLRGGVAAVAGEHGRAVLASGTHPTATWRDQELSEGERYTGLHDRWGLLALQQLIAGCHVHVSVPDPELAVQVLDRLRPDLPALLALSASSPFCAGTDTGYASYRTMWFSRWPVAGAPEPFGTRAAYDATVAALVRSGVADDASHLYWDVRPATRYPTLEVRVADTMPRLDADLLDARTGELVSAADLVAGLLTRVRDALEHSGDLAQVAALTDDTLARGTSARRQRALATRTGDLAQVVHAVVAEAQQG